MCLSCNHSDTGKSKCTNFVSSYPSSQTFLNIYYKYELYQKIMVTLIFQSSSSVKSIILLNGNPPSEEDVIVHVCHRVV